MPAFDEIRVALITRLPMGNALGMERLFQALADVDLEPTHAGLNDKPTDAFDRQVLIAEVIEDDNEMTSPSFWRKKAPKYKGHFNAHTTKPAKVHIDFGGESGATPYTAADAVAKALDAEFGYVQPIHDDGGAPWNSVANLSPGQFQEWGPRGVAARTYFGPHLTALIGAKKLTDLGARAVGKLHVLDLAARPWDAPLDKMVARQAEVTAALAGVFGDYKAKKPGARWKPLPAGR
jgi:hypothetical protein